ncbi:MAG: hypothetical protein KR126chlam2_00165 [Chlamydiae bacterium]|nr:hypothetical protein [Chlamydiota bacterium]
MAAACFGLGDKIQSVIQNKYVVSTLLVVTVAMAIIGAVALTYPHSFVGHIVGGGAGIIMTTCGTAAFTALLINRCCSYRRLVVVPPGPASTPNNDPTNPF